MKRERLVTRERVLEVADKIAASGTKPTNDLVLDEIGGSMRDIVPLVREWKKLHPGDDRAAAPDEPLPSGIEVLFRHSMSEVVQMARESARGELDGERRAARAEVVEAQQERDDLIVSIDRCLEEMDDLRASVDLAAKSATDERLRCTALEAQLAEEKQHRLLAEAREAEVKSHVQDLIGQREADQKATNHVRERLAVVQRELEGERIARAQSVDSEAALRRRLMEMTDELDACRRDGEAQATALSLEVDQLRRDREAAKLEVAQLTGELTALRAATPARPRPKRNAKRVETRPIEGRPDA